MTYVISVIFNPTKELQYVPLNVCVHYLNVLLFTGRRPPVHVAENRCEWNAACIFRHAQALCAVEVLGVAPRKLLASVHFAAHANPCRSLLDLVAAF